jgi:O-antigen/teichoic acid export membrane protein
VLTQLDKIILSRMLPLEQFGYYVLAGMVSSGLTFLVRPIFTSIFPRFAALVAAGDRASLERLYRGAWGLVLALIVPGALVVAWFPGELLRLWTRDPLVAQSAGPVLALLIVGTALNGLMTVPYALQVASGWTGLSVKVNIVLTIVAIPAVILAAARYGAPGAAAVWPVLMGAYVAIALPLIHRRLLPGFGMRWFLGQVFLPISLTLVVVVACHAILPAPSNFSEVIAGIAVAFVVAQLTVVSTTPTLRRMLLQYWSRLTAQQWPLWRTGE